MLRGIFIKGSLVKLRNFLDNGENVLQNIDIVLVEEEVVVLRARVTIICIYIVDAFRTRLCQALEQGQAVRAGLNLNTIVPHGEVQHGVQLVCAEANLVRLVCQERAVVAIVSHHETLFLQVELMGDDLESLSVVLDTVGYGADHFSLNRVRADDRLPDVHLAIFDLRDSF